MLAAVSAEGTVVSSPRSLARARMSRSSIRRGAMNLSRMAWSSSGWVARPGGERLDDVLAAVADRGGDVVDEGADVAVERAGVGAGRLGETAATAAITRSSLVGQRR